ncbi:50S ribosomal protein L11 methyltransferase [Streptomyces sp. SID8352]|uniref:50S ribosomal protein L11 methyltransferase n=1 Tax=Streptomyces sp. SID8352 TaxID=2690338 RepID=UPI001F26ED01|nr:50S ribosomal protein L11 methyltransferase [Streptomyces sp. SID8352]
MPQLTSVTGLTAEGEVRLALAGLRARAQELSRVAEATARVLAAPEGLSTEVPAFREFARESVPRWHFAMLNDHERNDALATALERVVPQDGTVLDIGAGTGLLAMMAVRAGARHVYSCETNPLMVEVARQVVAAEGYADRVTVLPCRSDELVVGRDLPRRADALVSEIVDCGLIGEGILPSVRHARRELLAPDGVMLPRRARLLGSLLHSENAMNLNRVGRVGGFDVSRLNVFATPGHFPFRLHTWPHRTLSDPVELLSFDFTEGPLGPGRRALAIPARESGTVHAMVAWFELDLGGGVILRNSPENVGSHWMQALIPLAEPVEAVAGTTVPLDLVWSETRLSLA